MRIKQRMLEWRRRRPISNDPADPVDGPNEEADQPTPFSGQEEQSGVEVEHKPVAVDAVPLSAMTREQLIDRILDHNRTATPEFLGQFEDDGLRLYLERLTRCSGPRTDRTGWVRKGTGRAIVAHVRMV